LPNAAVSVGSSDAKFIPTSVTEPPAEVGELAAPNIKDTIGESKEIKFCRVPTSVANVMIEAGVPVPGLFP
jgi:hypothetical protein